MKTNNILIRLTENKKIDFKVALLRQRVSMQSLLESFIDEFIQKDKGLIIPKDKNPLPTKSSSKK